MATTYSERLRSAMDRKNVKQTELAKAVGISQQTVQHLRTKGKGSSHTVKIAKYLDISPDWLASGTGQMEKHTIPSKKARPQSPDFDYDEELVNELILEIEQEERHQTKTHSNLAESPTRPYNKVPLISDIQAGNFCEAVDNFAPGDAEEWIPRHMPSSESSFALRVKGESMQPVFQPGEIVVVDPERAPTSGSYIVAKRLSDQGVTLKQLMQEGPDNYLKAANPDWPERIIKMTEEWHVCGVVIYSHRVHI